MIIFRRHVNSNCLTYNGQSSSYDSSGQQIQDDGLYTYVYDNNGNIIYKSNKSNGTSYAFEYSALNQLKKATVTSTPLGGSILKTIFYKYDPLGRRISRHVVDATDVSQTNLRKFYYDGPNIMAEVDAGNNLTATYTHSPLQSDDILGARFTTYATPSGALTAGQAIASGVGNVYYLKDHLNTVNEITNASGDIIQRFEYSAFGKLNKVRASGGTEVAFNVAPVRTSFTYTGREYEPELGMYYYRARYYDPMTGRFLQKDPDPGNIENPSTVSNRYLYAVNNPVMFNDPSGRIFGIDDALLIAIVVAAGLIQGGLNVNSAKDKGYSGDKLWQTFLAGFFTGALQAGAAIVYGPVGAIIGGFAGGTLNNAANQTIFPDSNRSGINWGDAFTAGSFSAAGAAVGSSLGYAFGESLGLATAKYTGTLFSGGQFAADLFGIVGSHIPASAAPSGISECTGSEICVKYRPRGAQ